MDTKGYPSRAGHWPVLVVAGLLCLASAFAVRAADVTVGLNMRCSEAVYRFLPGDYNYCVGSRYLMQGRYGSAVEMLELASRWGDKRAQYLLGILYFNGEHMPANRPLGLAWMALAAERDIPLYRATLHSALLKSSRSERHQAQMKLEAMRPTYGDAVAAARADRHYRRQMADLRRAEAAGSTVCIDGVTGGFVDKGDPTFSSCSPLMAVSNRMDHVAADYFEGWRGTVSVDSLQPVGKSSGQ